MVFWGIEVKPGKPYTLPAADNGRPAKLHIAVATLGFGSAKEKSYVLVNVGNKSSVLLCCLSPAASAPDTIPLHVDFEEDEEVEFSVIGPRSVHLRGKYVAGGGRNHPDDDEESESYGEYIGSTETERSTDGSDEYEDSFIDDDSDPEVIPSSPDWDTADDEMLGKMKSKEISSRRLRKRSEDEEHDSENDEEVSPIYAIYKRKPSGARNRISESEEEVENEISNPRKEMKDDEKPNNIYEGNADVSVDGDLKSGAGLPCNSNLHLTEAGLENDAKQKRKRKMPVEEEAPEADCDNHCNAVKEDKAWQQELKSQGMEHLSVGDEQNQKETNYM